VPASDPIADDATSDESELQYRNWTDSTGSYQIVASFVEIKDGRVRLMQKDGTISSIVIEMLSAADQAYAKELADEQAKASSGN
jgi:hypothetical protein